MAPGAPPQGAAAAAAEAARVAVAKAEFLQRWGTSYGYGGRIDSLYSNEIGRRMPANQHYLDYTGSALYCHSVLQSIFHDLQVLPPPCRLHPSAISTLCGPCSPLHTQRPVTVKVVGTGVSAVIALRASECHLHTLSSSTAAVLLDAAMKLHVHVRW